ncbi:MAG: hypothetical protein RhofKO_34980 [Rhodothermales bacterium]
MNTAMIWHIVWKDWTIYKPVLGLSMLAGIVSLALIGVGSQLTFYIGTTLLITVLVGMGVYLAIRTVVYERKEQTLPFLMSLPISSKEYTWAKLLGNALLFIVPWAILLIASLVLIATRSVLPNGLIPFATVLIGELLVAYILFLSVALISESEGWTIAAMVIANLFFQLLLFWLANHPVFGPTIWGEVAVWSPIILTILVAEVIAILAIIGVTLYVQGRKTSFL